MSILRSKATFAISLFLLALISLASSRGARAGEGRPNPFPRLLKSTAWVQTPEGYGTAWVYDRQHGLLVTNYHVIDCDATGELFDKVAIVFPAYRDGKLITERSYYEDNEDQLRASGRWVEARVIDAKESVDLALLKVERLPEDVTAVPRAAESAGSNDHLVSIGNSDEQALWLSTAGTVKVVSQRVWTIRLGKRFAHFNARVVLTEAPTNHGDSGGPVVSDAGELVGVTEGGKIGASLQNYAIDISEVRAYLDANAWMGKVSTAADYARRAQHYFADPTFQTPAARNRRVELALADLNQAIRLDPKNPDYYLQRARIHEYNLRRSGYVALSALPAMGAAERPWAAEGASLGVLMSEQFGSLAEAGAAQNDIRTALRLAPQSARAVARQGSLNNTLYGVEGIAVQQLEAAVHLDPDCVEAREELVSIRRGRDPQRAIHELSEIIRIEPANTDALAARADLYAGQGNYEAALGDYATALRLCPRRTEYRRGRANVYKTMNKPEEAFNDLAAIVEKSEPENVSVWREMGDLLAGAGKLEKAVFVYTRALTLIADLKIEDGSPEQLLLARGKVLAAAGARAEARRDLENALEIAKATHVSNPRFEKEVRVAMAGLAAT